MKELKLLKFMDFMMNVFGNMEILMYGNTLQMFLTIFQLQL